MKLTRLVTLLIILQSCTANAVSENLVADDSIWQRLNTKVEKFKKNAIVSSDIHDIPESFDRFYEKFTRDSIFQLSSLMEGNFLGIIGQCDTTIILTKNEWIFEPLNFKIFFEEQNSIEQWSTNFYFSEETLLYECYLKDVGIVYQVGFRKNKNRWSLELYYDNAC